MAEIMKGLDELMKSESVKGSEELFKDSYVTDPSHGGKVTCHKCCAFIKVGETIVKHYGVVWHPFCFNRYEHYYGLDRPID